MRLKKEIWLRYGCKNIDAEKNKKILPGAVCKLLEGGVRKKSCAQSDMNLKTIPVIDNVNEKGDTAVCNVMFLEERRLSDDAQNFQNSTPNNLNIWRQTTISNIS